MPIEWDRAYQAIEMMIQSTYIPMEKEQIESAYTKGREQWQKYEMESSQLDDVKIPTPRNYYNETYGNGNNL